MRPLLALTAAALLGGPALAGPITDPTGDTFGAPSPGLDIVASPGFTSGLGGYQLTVNFAGPISAPSLGAPNSVAGFIDLDLDRNPLTGVAPWASLLVPDPLNLGSEAYISLFDEQSTPGFVGLYDATSSIQLGLLPITFGPSSFTLTLPGSLIGSVPAFNYAMVSIPLDGGGFDRAPNGADPFTVPEPASVVVVGLLSFGAALRRIRHRASPALDPCGSSAGDRPACGRALTVTGRCRL